MATGDSGFLAEMTERLLVCEICQEDFQSPQRLPRVLPCHHAFCEQRLPRVLPCHHAFCEQRLPRVLPCHHAFCEQRLPRVLPCHHAFCEQRLPRVLPCHHAFCEHCLQQLSKDKRLTCPKCRSFFTVEGNFPVETTRMTLLDLKKITGTQEAPACEGCSEGARASHKCLECQELLCEECCRSHRRVKATRDHDLLALAEAAKDPTKLLQQKENCQQHKGEPLRFYCSRCQVAACSSCAILLHSGHKMVDLAPVLEERKKEVKAVCRRLAVAIPSFQQRVDNSSAGLKRMDAKHSETAAKVQELFSRGVQLLMARQGQVLDELKAMVKADRLALQDQLTSDQSLLSEAQASLQFGECVASLGLPSQLLPGLQALTSTCDSLESRGNVPAGPELEYKVDASKMAAVEAAVKEVGDIWHGLEGLAVSFPEFTFDTKLCSLERSVSDGGRVLSNRLQSGTPSQSDYNRCQFSGTYVSRPLPAESCFWQLRCVLTPQFKIENFALCDMGVLGRKKLSSHEWSWDLPITKSTCTVFLYSVGDYMKVKIFQNGKRRAIKTLPPFSPDRPVEVTLGFLLDAGKRHLYVIEVSKPRVLGSCQMELSSPLFPAAAVNEEGETGGEVRVELQTGKELTLSRDLAQLLTSLLERGKK